MTAPSSAPREREDWGEIAACLRRYYHMDRAEMAGTTVPEAQALFRALPDILKREAQLIGAASMGAKL